MRPAQRRRLGITWLLIGIAAVAALVFGALDESGPRTNADRVNAVAETIKCPQCPSESVAEANVAIAREIRADVARRVDAGETDDQIRAFYVERYGQEILLTPSSSGIAGLVWVIPVVAVVGGFLVLAFAFVRWRNVEPTTASDADRVLVAEALAGDHVDGESGDQGRRP